MIKRCSHCGYKRTRQLKPKAACPRCGYKPVHWFTRLLKGIKNAQERPYKPREIKYKLETPAEYKIEPKEDKMVKCFKGVEPQRKKCLTECVWGIGNLCFADCDCGGYLIKFKDGYKCVKCNKKES